MVRNYREIQVSSTVLVFIILSIIILGAVIFFIGVQVGKKQADLMVKNMMALKTQEIVSAPVALAPVEETATTSSQQPAETATETPVRTQPVTKPTDQQVSQTTARTTQPPATSPPRTNTTTPRTGTATAGNYFIQVGAFTDRPSARLEAEKYRKQGYNSLVKEPFDRDRKPLYRVWVGGYKTREEAQKVLSELISKTARNPGFFIVQQ